MIYLLKISQQKLFLGIHPINNYNTKEVYSTDSKFEHLLTSQFEVKKLGPKSLLDEKIKIPWSGPRFQIIHWSSLVSFETFWSWAGFCQRPDEKNVFEKNVGPYWTDLFCPRTFGTRRTRQIRPIKIILVIL